MNSNAKERGLPPFSEDFPSSRKVYVEADGLAVPMREIALSGDQAPLRVYDTTGPEVKDWRQGLPKLRDLWIAGRMSRSDGNYTQMHYARRGIITPEMEYVAIRENARIAEHQERYGGRRHVGTPFGATIPAPPSPWRKTPRPPRNRRRIRRPPRKKPRHNPRRHPAQRATNPVAPNEPHTPSRVKAWT